MRSSLGSNIKGAGPIRREVRARRRLHMDGNAQVNPIISSQSKDLIAPGMSQVASCRGVWRRGGSELPGADSETPKIEIK